jgi:hypothetical protein
MDKIDPTDPTDPKNSTDSTDSTDSIDATDPTNPTDPTDPTLCYPYNGGSLTMLVHNFLENSALRFPEKTALVCDNHRLTYRELNNLADRFAAALIERGIKRLDRVVIFLENSVESVISLYGVLKAGGVFVMLHPGMKAGKPRVEGASLQGSGSRCRCLGAYDLVRKRSAHRKTPAWHQDIGFMGFHY